MANRLRGVDRRISILEAAERLIARDGLDGIRSVTVAREAGVSQALPHYYYPTLVDLVRATYDYDTERANAFYAGMAASDSPRDRLAASLSMAAEAWTPERHMFLIEYARQAAFDENVRDLVQARLTAWDAFQITQITDGKERGEIAADVDVDVASLWLGCLYGGLGTLRLVGLVDGEEARRIIDRRLDAPDIWPRVGCGLGYQPAPTPSDDGAEEEADRRTEILDATLRLMGRVGVHGVHFLDVAAEAGLSDTLPRYYFPTLGDLLAAAFARVEVLEQRTVRRRAAGLADPFDRLRDAYVGELADDPGAMHDRWIAWGELMRLACVDDAMQERVQRRVARWIEEQAPLLAELQSTGRAAPNVPARAVLIPLIATLIGLGMARLLDVTSAERQRRTMLAAIDVELALPRA